MSEHKVKGDQLYRKVGGRYEPVDTEFWARPAPGIWLVEEKPNRLSHMHICRLDDLPDPMPLARIERHRDAAVRALLADNESWRRKSIHGVLDLVFLAIARAEASDEQ